MPTNASDFTSRRTAFGHRLRYLRQQAGYTGLQFSFVLGTGWPQSKVSKIETGRQTPTPDDLEDWLTVVSAQPPLAEQMREELRQLRIQEIAWRQQLRDGHRRQVEIHQLEAQTRHLSGLCTASVPGLFQTSEYARGILASQAQLHGTPPDDEEATQQRLHRQETLHEGTTLISVLITESALLHPVVSPQIMLAQLERLQVISEFSCVNLGILPAARTLPAVPLHGFWVYDDHLVLAETVHAELRIEAPDQIALHQRLLTHLHDAALTGIEARTVLSQLSRRYRHS